ncbi:hypothetical protein KI809_09610 [Geobacter pelophilus]|uniref:Uncharacterized protein n=1 Tax=Geoanaerobacter pelophilus TaxID=60036 RepID=A0AAW4L944_9BACT|nr:hypothetical protein [Geoanaerobacter pelophilus]MBT0664554.1 hypothetical protein [Geoanaerobacter pelophilus]
MKKVITILAVLCFSTSALAAQSITTTTSIGGGSFTPSAKVGISITSAANSYTATSCHVSGKKEFGSAGGTGITNTLTDTSKIYSKAIPAQQANATVCVPTATNSATAGPDGAWQ